MANNLSAIKRGWHYNAVTGNLEAYNNGNEIFQYPLGTNYYVDVTNGASTNSGKSWAQAFDTITNAFAAVTAAGAQRGRVAVYVAPSGSYSEAVSTPTNAISPHCKFIAINPLDYSHGAVYWASGSTSASQLTVLARGWRVSGFEFECPTTVAAVQLDSTNGNAAYTQVDSCHFTGGKYGINAIGAPNYINILRNKFDLIQTAGGIALGATAGANCNVWLVDGNIFVANINHIVFIAASAPYSGTWINNILHDTWVPGGSVTTAMDLTTSAASNIITQNYLGGTYSIAGGYQGGTTDEWFGNYANVTGGVTQVDPA